MVVLQTDHSTSGICSQDLETALLQGGQDKSVMLDVESKSSSSTHFLTYATHEAGMFQKLVNNEHGVNVTVLGWKQKWNDYRDRWHAYRQEILSRDSLEDVFILADAFDVCILRPIDKARAAFDKLGARLVISEAAWQNIIGRRMYLPSARAELPFLVGRSDECLIACAGLVMGYGSELVRLATIIIESQCSDDQRTLNTVLPFFESAVIDKDRKIFSTLKSPIMPIPTDVMCVHYPGVFGQMKPSRVLRSVREYSQYFIGDVAMVFLIATFLLQVLQEQQSPSAMYASGCGCFLILIYLLFCNKA